MIPDFLLRKKNKFDPSDPVVAAFVAAHPPDPRPVGPSERYLRSHLPTAEAEAAIARDRAAAAEVAATDRASRIDGWMTRVGKKSRERRYRLPPGYVDRVAVRLGLVQGPGAGSPGAGNGPQSPAGNDRGEVKMAKAKKEKKPAAERDVSAAVGLVSAFKQVRAGTARATVVEMAGKASGGSIEEIAKGIGKDRKTVLTHLFCMNRDCAFGYDVKGDKVHVTFPGSKTWKDAIKEASEDKKAA